MSSVQPTSDADSQHTTLGNAVQELPAKAAAPLLHHQQDYFFQVLVRELVLQFSYSTGNAREEEVLLQTLIGAHIYQLVADVGRQFLDELFSLHILLLENTDQILQLRFDSGATSSYTPVFSDTGHHFDVVHDIRTVLTNELSQRLKLRLVVPLVR